MGTPKRWVVPTTMSAPASPGGAIRQRASRSATATAIAFTVCAASKIGFSFVNLPEDPGYCTITPKYSPANSAAPFAASK